MINRRSEGPRQMPGTSAEESAAGNVVPFPPNTRESRQAPPDPSDPRRDDKDDPGPPAA